MSNAFAGYPELVGYLKGTCITNAITLESILRVYGDELPIRVQQLLAEIVVQLQDDAQATVTSPHVKNTF